MKTGTELQVTVEKLVFGGKGLARLEDGRVIFLVGDCLPGETVDVMIHKKKRDYLEARILNRLDSNPKRIDAVCPYFGKCGGCFIQNLSYTDQLEQKQGFLSEAITGIMKDKTPEILPMEGSEHDLRYRHKVELSFYAENDGSVSLGYFHKGTWFKIVDVKDCYLFDARIAPILEDLRAWVAQHDFKAFHNRRFTGLLRNFVLRKSISTDEWLVGLITTPEELSDEQMIELKDMVSKHVNVISFWQRLIDPKRKKGETFTDRLVWGQEYITENLAGVDYQIRFGDFFQNNVPQATKMVEYSLGLIKPEENSRILDLYCGVGTFTLPLAREFDAPVHGVEIVETAIRSAQHNAQINGIDGLTFECADVGKVVENTFATNYYDIVVVDPPRAGLVKSVVEQILQAQPKQIVYVSCNPSTLARDLDMLAEKYEIHHIKPFDLFPQTYHVECVAYLTLK